MALSLGRTERPSCETRLKIVYAISFSLLNILLGKYNHTRIGLRLAYFCTISFFSFDNVFTFLTSVRPEPLEGHKTQEKKLRHLETNNRHPELVSG